MREKREAVGSRGHRGAAGADALHGERAWGARVWAGWVGAMLALGMTGCDAPFFVAEPGPGELRGQWRINDSTRIVLGEGTPLVAHVRLRNEFSHRVRMVRQVEPVVEGKPDLPWKAYRKLPPVLEAGESWEGVWQLAGELEPGSYRVITGGTEVVDAAPADVEIRSERLPTPVRAQQLCVAARLTGEVDPVTAALTGEIEQGKAPPSTYLQLAELLEAVGNRDGARRQYELFAGQVYGGEEPPGWLRTRLHPSAAPGNDHE